MSTSAQLRVSRKPLLVRLVLASAALVSLCVACLFLSLRSVVMQNHFDVTDEQRTLLIADPHLGFYSARLYDSLGSGHVLRRLPRYQAITIISAYLHVFPDSYGQTVARHLPFRVSMTPPEYDVGLDSAARRLFAMPIRDIPLDQLATLIKYSARPAQHPLATSMPKYQVLINGMNFHMHDADSQAVEPMGFYVIACVVADSPEAAEAASVALLRATPELRKAVLNPPGDPPRMNVEEIHELEEWPAEGSRPLSGFAYYRER